MLRSLRDLDHYKVNASDGHVGNVVKFLLDDERWTVRYLVVQVGGSAFLENGPWVLVSPISFVQADRSTERFDLVLTMDKVKNSPSIDLDRPVSRQQEQHLSRYYGHPYYWGHSGIFGMGTYAAGRETMVRSEDALGSPADLHLRSNAEVRGYHVHGSDGTIGHIEDFIVDDETWEVRYLVVNTRNWWFGKHVLVAPQWASHISWAKQKVDVDLSKQTIKNSPEWDATAAISRAYETRLHEHYQRSAYWELSTTPEGSLPPSESRPDDVGDAEDATA
ncbi:MAG: hypothetical protein ACI9U2_003356 [Bradymonadia bacterium]|jgi:hypothetical protein